jgi:PIN domain nuclease of toxin-antitoxin system
VSISLVADTQILVWYLRDPRRLSRAAVEALEASTSAGGTIGVSAFSIIELVYAAEKANNPFTLEDLDVVLAAVDDSDGPFEVVPVDIDIAARMRSVPRASNADPGDRIVVATAEVLGVPLVGADSKIPAMTAAAVIW